MKKTISDTLRFALKLAAGLLLLFALHTALRFVRETPYTAHLIIPSYLSNFLMVSISYAVLLYFQQRKSQALGFIFLIGFFFKLVIFMLFFNPIYKADGEVQNEEFLSFFLPYAYCLCFETIVLVRLLNRSE